VDAPFIVLHDAEAVLELEALAVRRSAGAGESNPDLETLVNISRALGIEFVIDIAPATKSPKLVTRKVATEHAVKRQNGVSVVVAATG
jgi:hypothetical protein